MMREYKANASFTYLSTILITEKLKRGFSVKSSK